MADPKKYFQLVNRGEQNALSIVFGDSNSSTDEWYYCDWDLDGNGNIRTIQQEDALVQSTLKNIFTEKQINGYGTNIFDLIGEKDITVSRTSLFMDITMALLATKLFADAQADAQNLSGDDLVATVRKLIVREDSENPTWLKIQLALVTNSGAEVQVGVL